MCGIAGWAVRGGEHSIEESVLEKMLARLRHRGPDESGSATSRGNGGSEVALGIRRLSIIDVAGGSQPIFGEDGRVGVVCNGEIYNHLSLRRELEKKGHEFRTGSDVEAIVHLYEEVGDEFLDRLEGMFALAVTDGDRLLLARDRIGIKPLYFSTVLGPSLAFASEPEALRVLRAVGPDPASIPTFLAWGYIPSPATAFEGISKLAPGQKLVWESGKALPPAYWWRPGPPHMPKPQGDQLGVLESLLEEVVADHLMSEVPLGAFLSGGLDSSVIVALMSRATSGPVKTFTVGFEGMGGLDERAAARRVAEHLGCDHTELDVGDPALALDDAAAAAGEPMGDEASLPTYLMAGAAREHVTVVLTGEGGDEVFGGYGKYRLWPVASAGRRMPETARDVAARALGPVIGSRRASKLAKMAGEEPLRAGLYYDEVFTQTERESLLEGDAKVPALFPDIVGLDSGTTSLRSMLTADLTGFLADGLLQKVDRMTMAHGLEARVPYLDRRVVEFAVRLESRHLATPLGGKIALRKIAGRLLPESVANRKKHGFTIPIDSWLRGELRTRVDELTAEERLRAQGWWNVEKVREVVGCQRAGDRRLARHVWLLFAYQLWLEKIG